MNDLQIPTFLKRANPKKEPTMTQAAQQSRDDKPSLEQEAASLTAEVADLDAKITGLKLQRTAKHRELRAVTSKLVTLKLKSK